MKKPSKNQTCIKVKEKLLHFYTKINLIKSISNTRGPKDVAPFHLLLTFENSNGFLV